MTFECDGPGADPAYSHTPSLKMGQPSVIIITLYMAN